jgi:hypothetical protein
MEDLEPSVAAPEGNEADRSAPLQSHSAQLAGNVSIVDEPVYTYSAVSSKMREPMAR